MHIDWEVTYQVQDVGMLIPRIMYDRNLTRISRIPIILAYQVFLISSTTCLTLTQKMPYSTSNFTVTLHEKKEICKVFSFWGRD